MTTDAYDLWFYPRGGEHENDRKKRGTFATLAEAIAASDHPHGDCWDQSTSGTWILDDPIIEAAGRQYSWWSIAAALDRTLAEAHTRSIADLDEVLDVEAGLADIINRSNNKEK